jgi:class 3 adenylate cyclase
MTALPRGTVTLLVTDIEGSIRLWEEEQREVMVAAVAQHDPVLREAVGVERRVVVTATGDGLADLKPEVRSSAPQFFNQPNGLFGLGVSRFRPSSARGRSARGRS